MVESRVLHPNIQLTNITQQFHESAQRLPPGQLVKDEQFTLFEAVGALEIGDPKMDSGCLAEGEDLEDDFDFSAPHSAAQIIWLMDELTCREVAWHQGYPLSQTLFTSVHIDQLLWPEPKQLSDAQFCKSRPFSLAPDPLQNVLRAYCLGLIKCCDLVHQLITSHHYYEEEDFATHLFNRELLRPFPPGDILDLLHCVEKDVRASPGIQFIPALISRLNLRIGLLTMLTQCIDSTEPSPSNITNSLSCIDSIINSLSQPTYSSMSVVNGAFSTKIQRRLASSVPPRPMIVIPLTTSYSFILNLINRISSSYELFKVTHPHDLLSAYSTFTSQSPTPSAYIRCLLQSFLSINALILSQHDPQNFLLTSIQSLVLPSPNPLLDQSYAQIESPHDVRFQIRQHTQQFLAKATPLFINHYRTICQNRSRLRRLLCHSVVDLDGVQADAEELDLTLQTLVSETPLPYPPDPTNEGGSGIDSHTPQQNLTYAYPLSSFVYLLKLEQMQDIVLLGFELEIYALHEYAEMYSYLAHICSLMEGHLERISHFVSKSQQSYARFGGSERTGRWNGGHPQLQRMGEGEREKQKQETLRLLYRLFLRTKARDLLASALHRLYIVLRRHGHFSFPSSCSSISTSSTIAAQPNLTTTNNKIFAPYSSDKLRTDLRLLPFLSLSIPETLSHTELSHLTNLEGVEDAEILRETARLALEGRRGWEDFLKLGLRFKGEEVMNDRSESYGGRRKKHVTEGEGVLEKEWKEDVKGCIKACIALSISVTVLSKALEKHEMNQNAEGKGERGEGVESVLRDSKISAPSPGEEGRWHRFWAVPKIQQ